MGGTRVLDTFLDLVRIDSPSRREANVARYCERALRDMGFSVSFDDSAEKTGSDTGNLIARLEGTSAGRIALSAHMDCVEPCAGVVPVVEDGVVRSAGDTVLGADDKAGIAAILEGVRSVVESGASRPEIVVVLTTCEELSLLGALHLDEGALGRGDACYVFDAGGAPGTIILGSPRHYEFEARFLGRASHAGAAPEQGLSAIQMAASALSEMQLGRLDDASTANVGMIEGGTAVNVVPDACVLKGECRSISVERSEEIRRSITQACERAAAAFGGDVSVRWHLDYEATDYDPHDDIVLRAAAAARAAGLAVQLGNSGGGADANAHVTRGVRAITLGIGMTDYHSVDEHISCEDLEGSARLVEALVLAAAE